MINRNKNNNNNSITDLRKSKSKSPIDLNKMSDNNNHHSYNRLKSIDKDEMSKFVIWKRPFKTVYYFIKELVLILIEYIRLGLMYKKTVSFLLLISFIITVGFQLEGKHLPYLLNIRKQFLWCAYWVGLGVASSIGLGTGLHTFLLYLGPFIAEVTMAAYECKTLNFSRTTLS